MQIRGHDVNQPQCSAGHAAAISVCVGDGRAHTVNVTTALSGQVIKRTGQDGNWNQCDPRPPFRPSSASAAKGAVCSPPTPNSPCMTGLTRHPPYGFTSENWATSIRPVRKPASQ